MDIRTELMMQAMKKYGTYGRLFEMVHSGRDVPAWLALSVNVYASNERFDKDGESFGLDPQLIGVVRLEK